MAVASLNGQTGSLTLSGFSGSTAGTVELASGAGSVVLGQAVTTFTGSSQGSPKVRSGNVTISAGDVSAALSSGHIYNLLDYGGDPSGGTDSSSALSACINAAVSGHGWAYVPSGTYLLGSAVIIAPTAPYDIVVIGDTDQTSIFKVNHGGVALTINQLNNGNTYSTVIVRNLFFFPTFSGGYSAAALSLIMWGVLQNWPGAPYVTLLVEDIRIWGVGSNNTSPQNQCFAVGIQLQGSINSRFNRISWAGPLISKSPPNSSSTPNVGNAIELTSAVEVHLDSWHVQNGHFAVAILDGGSQGIYVRQGTFVGVDYLVGNVASSVYNSAVIGTLASQASAGSNVLTFTNLGNNPLDAKLPDPQPWIGHGMGSATSQFQGTVTAVSPSSNVATISSSLTTTLPQSTEVTLQYLGFSGIDLTVVNSEVNTNFGIMQVGKWEAIRMTGNDFYRGGGPPSTSSLPVTQFDFSDVSSVTCAANSFANGAQDTSLGDTCFKLQFISLNASDYAITGNTFTGPFDSILSVGSNVLDVQFLGNATGQTTSSSQFSDANPTTRNVVLYSNNGVLTSANPLAITAPQGLTLPGLPTTNPGAGTGKLWNNHGVVSIA